MNKLHFAWAVLLALLFGYAVVGRSVPLRYTAGGLPSGLAAAAVPAASGHNVVLTCTAPASMPSGAYFNFYRGAAAGAESATPVNATGAAACGYTDTAVNANTAYWYIAETCAISLATGAPVCSVPSNEVKVSVPLSSGDLTAPLSLSGVGN